MIPRISATSCLQHWLNNFSPSQQMRANKAIMTYSRFSLAPGGNSNPFSNRKPITKILKGPFFKTVYLFVSPFSTRLLFHQLTRLISTNEQAEVKPNIFTFVCFSVCWQVGAFDGRLPGLRMKGAVQSPGKCGGEWRKERPSAVRVRNGIPVPAWNNSIVQYFELKWRRKRRMNWLRWNKRM